MATGFQGVTHDAQSVEATKKLRFTNKGMGEVGGADGVRLPFTFFEASDGIKLTAISGDFDLPERAKQHLDAEVRNAKKVIETGAKKNAAGKRVGARARLLVSSDDSGETSMALVWTQGRYFHEILSTSWKDILELEKRYSD